MKLRPTPLKVAGETINVTYETVHIDTLRLNPQNPRIRFQIKHALGAKQLSEPELIELVRAQPGYDGLHKSIRKSGGIHEPVLITHDGDVVEGNSRATAYKVLHVGKKADPRWQKIPVARLAHGVSQSTLALMMAAHHIAGKTVWRAFAQADHIYELRHVHDESVVQIADETRMNPREIEQYIEAYEFLVKEVMPAAGKGAGREILEKKFSHALEFVKGKRLESIRKDPKKRKEATKLIATGAIKGQEVRHLDKIMKSSKAMTALKTGGMKQVREVMREIDPVSQSKVLKDMQALADALADLGGKDLDLLKTSAPAQAVLVKLNAALRDVASFAGVKLSAKNV